MRHENNVDLLSFLSTLSFSYSIKKNITHTKKNVYNQLINIYILTKGDLTTSN